MDKNNIIVEFHFSGERPLTFGVCNTVFCTSFLERLSLTEHWHTRKEICEGKICLPMDGKKVKISQEIPACVQPAKI